MPFEWSDYGIAYDRVLRRTPTYRKLLTDLVGITGGLPLVSGGGAVLDCGSGTGNLCELIAETAPNATIVGIDSDPGMVQLAQDKFRDRLSETPKPGHLCFFRMDALESARLVSEYQFLQNYVFLVNVLYLIDDPVLALRNLARCLLPGGEIRISNPDEKTDIRVLLDTIRDDLIAVGAIDELSREFEMVSRVNIDDLSPKLRRYSRADISRFIFEAGFRAIKYESHNHYAGQALILSASL